MKRRNFIIISAVGIAAITIPALYSNFRDIEYDSSLAQPLSLSFIWDSDTLNSIGASYLMQVPKENNEQNLVKRIIESGDSISKLEEQIIKDFETGNTVMIDGWILSVTEARQCALYSIITQQN